MDLLNIAWRFMRLIDLKKLNFPYSLNIILFITVVYSCTPSHFSKFTNIRKPPANRLYVVKNSIEVKGGKFTKLEKEAVTQRLTGQLDDSSKLTTRSEFLFLTKILRPPGYDSGYAAVSARNMLASMYHLGYYNAIVTFNADTFKQQVHVRYIVDAGKPTLIDTLSYRLRKPDLQSLAVNSKEESILVKNNPVTKAGVLGEISRLVDTFRNNGYYKFTAAELKVRGDTTIEALTTVTDDPFEQLRLLAEAQQQRDSPKIRLAIVINPPSDSSKLRKFYINKIYILPDYRPGDNLSDTNLTETVTRNYIIRYHEKLFKNLFLAKNVSLKSGDTYRQDEYYRTVNNFSGKGVWQSINIRIAEVPDSLDLVNVIIELIPGKKFGFEAALEASYSATSNTTAALAGNLFGLSGNLTLLNRNFGKEAIRMTHSFRAGIELNNNARASNTRLKNSQELSYGNNIVFPRLVTPFPGLYRLFKKGFQPKTAESFINTNLSYNNRLGLFDLQSVNVGFGSTFLTNNNWKIIFKPVNVEFSYLFNQTDSFKKILDTIPFLRYSYNTAFIVGMSGSISRVWNNPRHLRSISKESSLRFNIEESGMTYGALPIAVQYKRKYIKADLEYKRTVSYRKTALAIRGFIGVGAAFGKDTTLPFFKQYFGGGSNSMRGWPVRGIGRGSQKLVEYKKNIFNDRTADMQFETNIEYRYDIARIIPNTLTLRGAIFTDIGNIWNLRNSNPDGSRDSTQFKLSNFYKELGLAAGTGFRLDFNYFILRFDFGFRFKRPELSHINNGWQAPKISFNDFFPKLFGRGDENRRWRYENFNFTIGISYPF
ncbi:MAG: BamA/TamA family outer membrane protein [Ferruginibacter sp.]